jgi:hypothetical protein
MIRTYHSLYPFVNCLSLEETWDYGLPSCQEIAEVHPSEQAPTLRPYQTDIVDRFFAERAAGRGGSSWSHRPAPARP